MDYIQALETIDRIEKDLAGLKGQLEATFHAGLFSAGPFAPEGEVETGFTYFWPPKQEDRYLEFQRYRGPDGVLYGIGKAEPLKFYGRERPYSVVHEVGRRDQLNGVVVFVAADDFDESNEMLSIVKGAGAGGRSMFRPGGPIPSSYVGGRLEPFKSRVNGPYSRDGIAVVCDEADFDVMLTHAVLQKRLRTKN